MTAIEQLLALADAVLDDVPVETLKVQATAALSAAHGEGVRLPPMPAPDWQAQTRYYQ